MDVGDYQLPGTSRAPDEQTHFELLLLIERFLASGPCRKAAAVLRKDIEENKLVPIRHDFNGNQHLRKYLDVVYDLPFSTPSLMDMVSRLSFLSDLNIPPSIRSLPLRLVNNKRNCLTRTAESSMCKSLSSRVLSRVFIPNSIVSHLRLLDAREFGTRVSRTRLPGPASVEQMDRHCRVLGHLSMVYCVAFDRTGRYVLTGADDNLIKVWDARHGMLRFTYRGHSSEIADMSVSYCNQMVASGSVDKSIRVWSLQTGETVQVFKCHTAVVARVKFLPFVSDHSRYLVSCAFDCQVVYYKFNENTMEFGELTRFFERDTPGARIISLCHSTSGQWVVVGDSHCYLRVFRITQEHGVRKMCDINAHTDRVDSLEWAHGGLRFASGSRDGVAKVWKFSCGQWKSVPLHLQGAELQNAIQSAPTTTSERSKSKYRVTMLCWTLDDSLVVTAGSDHVLRTWNPCTGDMLMKLPGHTDDAFVLQAHPVHPEIVLSCGHDGVLAIWDILSGKILRKFTNGVEHRGHSALFDLDVSRDGCSMAAVDSLGHVLIFGLGSNQAAKSVPKQQFFCTDYTPLIQDDSGWVLDESTGLAPHLMPPALLTDQDLLAHDAEWQRYVPGRDGIKDNDPAICAWLNRAVVPPLPLSERKNNIDEMEVIMAAETQEYDEEISREPEPEVEVIVQTVGERRKSGNRTRARQIATRHRIPRITMEEAIAAQDARRAGAELVDYQSDMDDSYSDTASSSAAEGSESDTSDTDFSVGGRDRERERRREPVGQEPEVTTTSSGRRVQRRMRTTELTNNETQPIRREGGRRRVVIDGESSQEDGTEEDEVSRPSGSSDRRRRNRHEEPFIETPQTTDASNIERRKKERKKKVDYLDSFPEWMRTTVRRRFPYIAQLGDQVVYFRQGHEQYLNMVEKLKLYPVSNKMRPKVNLDAEEFCIVDEVRYVRKPYRLTVVRLSQTDREGERTGLSWTVKFHDLDGSPDFIIHRHHYDLSIQQNLEEGDRIEAILDGKWWIGTVNQREPHDEAYSNSLWYCLRIKWETGEDDLMSPWDCQPKSQNRRSSDEATEADHVSFADCPPLDDDWIGSDVYGVAEAKAILSRRLLNAIDSLRGLETVAPFATAVNLEEFPNYAMNIDYPIDLEKISERIRCGFYRRLRSLHQDIRCIAVAAEQFNEPDSVIVRNARVLVEALILFSQDPTADDIVNSYDSLFDVPPEEIVEYRRRQWTRIDADLLNMAASQSSVEQSVSRPGWVRDCKGILQSVMRDPCAVHFLKADTADEELAAALEQSCDLSSLVDMLDRGEMSTPHEVAQRVEQMVHACRNCIDDKRNPIYRDSLSLGSLFAEKMRVVISQFERIWNNLDLGGRELRKRQKRERHRAYNTRSCDNRQNSQCLPSTSQQSGQSNNYHCNVMTQRSIQHLEIQAPPVPSTSASGERRTQSRKDANIDVPLLSPVHVSSAVSEDSAYSTSQTVQSSSREDLRLRRRQMTREPSSADSSPVRPPPPRSRGRPRGSDESQRREAALELQELIDDIEENMSEQDVSEDDSRRPNRRNGRKRRDTSEERPSRYSTRSTNNISKRRRIGSSDDEVQSSRRGVTRDSLIRRRTTNTVNYAESDDEEQIESISSRGRVRRIRHFL